MSEKPLATWSVISRGRGHYSLLRRQRSDLHLFHEGALLLTLARRDQKPRSTACQPDLDYHQVSRRARTLGLYTTEVYQQSRDDIIKRQAQELLELSTPVVQLWDKILVLPLIGTLTASGPKR